MKRNNNKVPGFDEIIFENRNKTYGAYDLRKRYKSAASVSILAMITVSAVLISTLSFTPGDTPTKVSPQVSVIELSRPPEQVIVPPPETKPPANLIKSFRNIQPQVVTDSMVTNLDIPITDLINANITNGNLTDTAVYTEPIAPEITVEKKIFTVVEEDPEYPGGYPALFKYIGENLSYPREAERNNIQGKVILKFVVNPDGSVGTIEILKGIDPLLENEAVRVVKTLPKFKPGKQGGVPVHVWFMLPVLFKIENN